MLPVTVVDGAEFELNVLSVRVIDMVLEESNQFLGHGVLLGLQIS